MRHTFTCGNTITNTPRSLVKTEYGSSTKPWTWILQHQSTTCIGLLLIVIHRASYTVLNVHIWVCFWDMSALGGMEGCICVTRKPLVCELAFEARSFNFGCCHLKFWEMYFHMTELSSYQRLFLFFYNKTQSVRHSSLYYNVSPSSHDLDLWGLPPAVSSYENHPLWHHRELWEDDSANLRMVNRAHRFMNTVMGPYVKWLSGSLVYHPHIRFHM